MADSAPLKCSIVIRAFNEERYISRLLDGISRQQNVETEVILVDSGSTDQTVPIAARYPVKIVHINPNDFSFGRSLNLGIAESNHDLVVIASAHVFPVYPDWLDRLLEPLKTENVALSYGRQRGDECTHFSEQQIFTRWYPDVSNLNQAHPFCNNANAAIRRDLWEAHPYDETLTGLEDLGWALWAKDQGYAIAYVAEAEVIHIHQQSASGVYNRYRREAMAYKQIFPSEHFSFLDFLNLTTSNVFRDLQVAARKNRLLQNLAPVVSFRTSQFWGTYQGYRNAGPLTAQLRQTFYYPHDSAHLEPQLVRDVEPIRYGDV